MITQNNPSENLKNLATDLSNTGIKIIVTVIFILIIFFLLKKYFESWFRNR